MVRIWPAGYLNIFKLTWDVSEGFEVVVGDVVGVDDTAADHVPVLYTWVMTCRVRGDHYQTQSTFHLSHSLHQVR